MATATRYGGYRRAYWGGGYGGYRRAYWGGGYASAAMAAAGRGGPYGGVTGTAAAAGAGSADDEANGYPAAGARGRPPFSFAGQVFRGGVAIRPDMLIAGRPMKPFRIRKS